MIHAEPINRAIDYILAHINEEISVDDVASYCNFSKYYFSRMFKTETGESLYGFIKRVKMEQSAFRLKIEKDRTITDIGGDYGYSASNYSSAFKEHYRLSPMEFRRSILQKSLENPILNDEEITLESFQACNEKISVETFPDFFVIYERYKGDYGDLIVHWGGFLERYQRYVTDDTLLFERSYDDPSVTDRDQCLRDICMSVSKDCPLENTCVLKGGRFAVYHFKGDVSKIYAAYQSIFNVWLPCSKVKIDERYSFDIYRKVDCDTMLMEIDLCVPIK